MKFHILLAFLFVTFIFAVSCSKKWSYPAARKGDVVENYHGTDVADPYRWMKIRMRRRQLPGLMQKMKSRKNS